MLVRVVGDTFVRTVINDDTHTPVPEYHALKFSFPMSNIALGKVGKAGKCTCSCKDVPSPEVNVNSTSVCHMHHQLNLYTHVQVYNPA